MRQTIALLATALAAASIGAAAPASASSPPHVSVAAARHCPHFHLKGNRFQLVIYRGHVSCRKARRVMRRFLSGHGKHHGHGPMANQYWTLGRWKCGHGAGGGGCIRGGESYKDARDWIEASID